MYAIKGGWIGQTFALATCNDSGGRKARIRRSKEERKAMVESFIKTYQISNDGKFPSLNLTHKEVGGSFYTVREIVRDIIQENRVLGPARFNSDGQKLNGTTRESPSESTQDYLFQLENENIDLLHQHTSAIVEMDMNGNEQYAKFEAADAGEFVGKPAIEETEKLVYVDAIMNGSIGEIEETELLGSSEGYKQLDKHDDLDAEQLVYGSIIEGCDEEVSTESSVRESVLVEQEAELEATGCSEKANFEIDLNLEDLDAEQLIYGKECDEVLYTESSISESFVVEQEAELEVTGSSENANLEIKLNLEGGSIVEEYDEVVATESSVSDSISVEQEAELEVTSSSANANLEIKLDNTEEKTKHDVLDFGKHVNGSQVEESDKIKSVEPSLVEKHEVCRDSGSVEQKITKLSPTENIVVETFPLRSVTNDSYTVDIASKLNGSRGLNQDLEKLEGNCVSSGNVGAAMDSGKPVDTSVNASLPSVQKVVNNPQASSSNGNPAMVHETISKNASDMMEVKEPSQSGEAADIGSEEIEGAKVTGDIVFPNNYEAKFANYNMELKDENLVTLGVANEKTKEHQAPKESKPTLDRINLGSWEGASKKSFEQQKNPLFIFLKSLVSSFMKFLSE